MTDDNDRLDGILKDTLARDAEDLFLGEDNDDLIYRFDELIRDNILCDYCRPKVDLCDIDVWIGSTEWLLEHLSKSTHKYVTDWVRKKYSGKDILIYDVSYSVEERDIPVKQIDVDDFEYGDVVFDDRILWFEPYFDEEDSLYDLAMEIAKAVSQEIDSKFESEMEGD